jgi:hypothetical protein
MRIATVCGVLFWLAGCNQLPADPVSGDDQSLYANGNAGSGAADDAGKADPNEPKNGTTEAAPSGVSDCELKAKDCYAQGLDPKLCDSILQGCFPPGGKPAPTPSCGEDCDASVRACFAKGVDAKTCDAQYHACLSNQPGGGKFDPGAGEPAPNDPVTQCEIAAKQCFADGATPPEKCQALLDSCAPQPANDPVIECQIAAKQCFADGSTPAEKCQALLDSCAPPPATTPADDQGVQCKLEYAKCLDVNGEDTAPCDAAFKECLSKPVADANGNLPK